MLDAEVPITMSACGLAFSASTFAVITPRLIFRSDYNSQDQVTIQYSHWFDGSGVNVRTGYPPQINPALTPDPDTLSIMASMWW